MTTPAAFKKAMQQLTTTIVKAERADPESTERARLQAEVSTLLEALIALHAELDPTGTTRPHQTWFDQTVARARVILAPHN